MASGPLTSWQISGETVVGFIFLDSKITDFGKMSFQVFFPLFDWLVCFCGIELWKKVKEESKNVGLKFNIQKTKIMASGPLTSWQIDGETVTDFIFWGSTITADGDSAFLRENSFININWQYHLKKPTVTEEIRTRHHPSAFNGSCFFLLHFKHYILEVWGGGRKL